MPVGMASRPARLTLRQPRVTTNPCLRRGASPTSAPHVPRSPKTRPGSGATPSARARSGALGSGRSVAAREPSRPPAGGSPSPPRLLDAALAAARAAGAVALRYFTGGFEGSHKADHSPRPPAHRQAGETIVGQLPAAFPGLGGLWAG